jgi:hypothetical protein
MLLCDRCEEGKVHCTEKTVRFVFYSIHSTFMMTFSHLQFPLFIIPVCLPF